MDTTLVNFSEMKWERGDITFLFIGEHERKHSFYVLDNKFRVYQKIKYQVAVCIFCDLSDFVSYCICILTC